jgi:hypothetical protein
MDQSLADQKARFLESKKLAEKNAPIVFGAPPKKTTGPQPPASEYGTYKDIPQPGQQNTAEVAQKSQVDRKVEVGNAEVGKSESITVEEALAREKQRAEQDKPGKLARLKQVLGFKGSNGSTSANEIGAPFNVQAVTHVVRPDIKDALVNASNFQKQISAIEKTAKTAPGMDQRLGAKDGHELRRKQQF